MVNLEIIGYFPHIFVVFICLTLISGIKKSGIELFETLGKSSDVHFWLWTRSNPNDDDYFVLENGNLTNLKKSPFDGSRKTYFIFHGFTSNGRDDFILKGKANLLSIEDCNYISVEYSKLIPGPDINEAVNNVYVTGKFTASFIDWLDKISAVKTTQIQLVGFSLGAHTAGMTGYHTTSGKIDRITGLDPAGRLFYTVSADKRLDKTHASLVDVIHTNGGLYALNQYGLQNPIGHIDFYPNGGQDQPGCPETKGCNHRRAPDYWVESILAGLPNCRNETFLSWPCEDWETFQKGDCATCGLEGCLEMGFHLNKRFNASGMYFLRTNPAPPFALGNVQ